MFKNPTLARVKLHVTVLEAASRDPEIDPSRILPSLDEAAEELEAEFQSLLTEREQRIAELQTEAVAFRSEISDLRKLLRKAQDDSVHLGRCDLSGPLANPRGFYVYTLWDAESEPLYVGMSFDVLRRLGSHLNNGQWGRGVARISWVQCRDGREMRRLEIRTIHKLAPRWNTADLGQSA